MHPELRRARALYHEWRCLPEASGAAIAGHAHRVKGLALDLRGYDDPSATLLELERANGELDALLATISLEQAA